MGADELVPVLEKVDLFHDLDPKLLRRIADSGRVETFAPGSTLCCRRARRSAASGRSRPRASRCMWCWPAARRRCVAGVAHGTLGPGDYFGEVSLIDGKPRSADIVAGDDGLTTLGLAKWTFHELLEDASGDRRPDAARHDGPAARRRAPEKLTSGAYAGQNSRDQVKAADVAASGPARAFWKRLMAALV